MNKTYDIAVIGGGPGGYIAAFQAAENGKKVAIIESDFLGGTCLNRGCIPSKTLLKHAEIIESIEKANNWGIETGTLTFSLQKMKKRKDDVIQRLRNGIAFLMKKGQVDVFEGFGMLEDNNQIKILQEEKDEVIHAEKIIIATGSTPVVPPIPGLNDVHFDTSDTIFELPHIPESITIIGGGVIGVEFACIFASLKSKVTVIEMSDRLVPGEDLEASKLLEKVLKKKGVQIFVSTKVEKVKKAGDLKSIVCTDKLGKELTVETESLLISVGRRPNLSAVANQSLQMNGPFIKVNKKMETNLPNVYAVGDVVGGYQLAHVASAEGIVAANNASGKADLIDYKVVPRCIYTLPEIASVGMTEAEALQIGLTVRTEKFDLSGSGKALALGETEGFTKIVYDEKYGEIIGVTMVGPHVTEIISEASAFMFLEGTVDEVAKMIHPHPTVSEAFFEAALMVKNNQKEKAFHN
ncbi:dihydrolipoyl dehydrogenase [Heyndrickxia camelliae]|uniref:Dihydrolipoyl dehydrogenase n=1 Tax=Heyndrickxia camelliae TaxID=1707093 RepID=A0A2N3LNP2_9BACI|nr:dihydrolipoyl dehydrogenase [Heyndrickxia camelliae]PKR86312.1 dihydrolipoyl dehydrogenase [Heyndrickxia camelliae]